MTKKLCQSEIETRICPDCDEDFDTAARNSFIRCPVCRAAKSQARRMSAAKGYRSRRKREHLPTALSTTHVVVSTGVCQGACRRTYAQRLTNNLCEDCCFYGVKAKKSKKEHHETQLSKNR